MKLVFFYYDIDIESLLLRACKSVFFFFPLIFFTNQTYKFLIVT